MMTEEQALAAGKTCNFTGEFYDTLEEAVDKANNHGGGTITLIADTVVSNNGKVPDMCFHSNFAIRSKKGGPDFRIFRGKQDRKEMLQITDGTLRLFNVILDGACEGGATRAALRASDLATVEMKSVTICNNQSNNAGNVENQGASAICLVGDRATLKADDKCVIKNCSGTGTAVSAIVASGGTFTNGGITFENNTAEAGGNPNYTDLTGNTNFSGTPIV